MDVNTAIELIEKLGFPIVLASGAVWYTLKTSKDREAKMWDTINGFQGILNKFDATLRDISFGLKEVKEDIAEVKTEVEELKDSVKK